MTSTTSPARPETDVLILGSGLAGSALAAVLARNGATVLVLDAGTHPRFAIGESTIPYTSMLMRLVAERYDVPEIKHLATFENCQAKITTQCGVKRNFGFLYHREGRKQRFGECHQFPIPKITHTENHFFRQDTDAWMVNVALKYGARLLSGVRVDDVSIDEHGVTATDSDGREFRARYIVDASGFRSPIAQKFGLREEPTRLRHHSRGMFTHMLGVTPYDDTVPAGAHQQPQRWHEGTLHHLFEGGWMWVIPFNNHARSTNPLVSVGLLLDPRIHPQPEGLSPQEEFDEFVSRFPDIKPQFVKARAAREWVRTGRLQYSSSQTVGYRWCLTSHAAGFVDALYSKGLSNSFEIVNALGWRLLDALRDDDFSEERFAYVQDLEQGLLDTNDELVANSYTSFRNFELWDAWFRVWAMQQVLATLEINRAYAKYLESHDPADLELLARLAPDGALSEYAPARRMLADVNRLTRLVQAGEKDAGEAAREVMAQLVQADFVPPAFGLTDPSNRWFNATWSKAMRSLVWARTDAPPEIGELTFEGLTLFMKHRLNSDEFDLVEELKHKVAPLPLVGRRLRTPVPK